MIISNFPFVGNIKNQIETHNLDNSSHPDIRKQLEALSGGGVGEKELFEITFSTTDGVNLTSNKTAQEIDDALSSQKFIYAKVPAIFMFFQLISCSSYSGSGHFIFTAFTGGGAYGIIMDYSTIDNTITATLTEGKFRALDISYRNNDSSLSADNVQDAIDELASSLTSLATEDYVTNAITTAANKTLTESKSYADQKITGGTTDIGEGAPLASGAIYIVYK